MDGIDDTEISEWYPTIAAGVVQPIFWCKPWDNISYGEIYIMENCEKVNDRYDRGVDVCTSYLKGKVTIHDVAE